MDLKLKDKVVAITGGTSGIGEEVALAFANEGSKVAVCGRSAEKIEALKKRFEEAGHELFSMSVDVANSAELKAFTEAVTEKYGRLDVFINNAGLNIRKPFDQYTEEEWHHVVDIDFKAVYFGCAFAAEQMRKTGGGVIINTSSFTSVIPTCGLALYSASKAAVDQLTKVLSAELAADNIRVVSIQPGMTVTPLTKDNCAKNFDGLVSSIAMKRLAMPEDIVPGYLFLASEAAGYINGIALQVAGAKFTAQNPHYSYRKPGAQW